MRRRNRKNQTVCAAGIEKRAKFNRCGKCKRFDSCVFGSRKPKNRNAFRCARKTRSGYSKSLINFAVNTLSADEVTVNEQNLQAVGFYKRMGFETYKRTDLDEQGNAYPLLYMRIQ